MQFSRRKDEEPASDDDDSPLVSVEQGMLRGEWVSGVTGNGFQFAAFRWIPYAKAPRGSLRFKGPRPAPRWDGIRNATTEGDACFQFPDGQLQVSEDCLVLNVFTPQLPQANKTPLPVLFFIHGGTFSSGSPSSLNYGPDFLVTQDIVVVTVSYRVNVFGFLSFDDAVVPGNAGIKDQIFALQWVQRNIGKFGGDPHKVTIQGQSAGATCAHWLTLLPQTAGLFRAAILQSGNALQGLGYVENNIVFAEQLGEVLGGQPANLEKLSQRMMEVSAEELLMAALQTSLLVNFTVPGDKFNEHTLKLGIVPQRNSLVEERLILRDPESYILNRSVPDVPLLMGMTGREWLFFWYNHREYDDLASVEAQIENLVSYIPLNIIPYKKTQRFLGIEEQASNYNYRKIADHLKVNIFDPVDKFCDSTCKLKKYQDKIHIEVDVTRLARLRAIHSNEKTFLYKFNVKSDFNVQIPAEASEDDKTGVVHTDDLQYLFHNTVKPKSFSGNSLASKTLRRMVKMWANFVKFMDPTPHADDPDLNVKWNPYDVTKPDVDTFLHIGEDLTMRQENIADDVSFWLDIYRRYRHNKSI